MESITLKFNTEQLVIIDKAIQQMPYHVAAPIISSINTQIQAHFDSAKNASDEAAEQSLKEN